MGTVWISLLLLAFAEYAVSEYNPSVCSILEDSYGLIPPPLPTNFELKAERVDHNRNYAAYEEIYFDYDNSRAKYKSIVDSLEYNHLFDYDTKQVVEWIKVHPGTAMKRDPLSYSCEAVNMEESPYMNTFGFLDGTEKGPRMLNSYQMLRYGGQYMYAANGTLKLDERGLQVNKFIGCIYDKYTDATMFNDYYFADTNKVQPSGGTPSTIVTGSDDKPLSVPVKLHLTGHGNKNDYLINETFSISWFKGDPQFERETFQIPPWIHCKNYRGRKEIPKFPKAFSTRVVLTSYLVDILGQLQEQTVSESYEEIFYDSEKNLARRDFKPNKDFDTDIYGKFGNYNPVSTIYDFNEGLRYTMNKVSGRCYIQPIMNNEYFDSGEEQLYRKLATPEEIFLMQMDDMEYKGTAFSRDIECDVWNGKHYHEKYGATFVKEVYFSTNGWHEISDGMVEYGVPVRNVLMKKELDGEAAEGISTYNFLKFKAKAPKMLHFDLKNCVELVNRKRFALELTLNPETSEIIFKYRSDFLEAAHLYIAKNSGVKTPLRVQRIYLYSQPTDSSSRVFLVFSLLDKAPLKDVYGQRGLDLEEATLLLQKFVNAGNFSVEFITPLSKETIAVPAERGSLYYLTADSSLPSDKPEVVIKTYEEKKGMTGGHLALLAFAMLFIGTGIGIAIMYLYIRIYSERLVEDRIDLTSQTAAPSTA